ncbi:hypothetical protein BC830DRAFT_197989 [Chytriomyces sp. MP71]|nr:hypothetical protein BC830DRAFT_197989 [Chytriomyces sp. MP71]
MVQKRFRMNDGTRSKNIVECDLEVAEVVECSPTDDVDDSQMDAGRVFSLTECDILQNELSLNALGSAANISTMKVALAPANHEAVEIESKEPFFHINDASTDCLDDPKDTNLEQVVDFSLGCTPSPTRSTVQVDIHSKMSDANLHSSQVVSSSSIDAAPRTNPHSRSLAMEVDVSDNPFYVPVGHADIFGEEEECNELISPSPLSPDPRDRRVVIPISPEGTFDQDAFSFLSPVKLAAVHLKLAEAVRSKKIPHNITIAGIKKQTDVKKEQSAALSVKKENHSTSEKSIMGLLLSPIKGVWQGLGWIE